MTAGALKRACHHVCKQPRSAPLNPQTWLYGVSSRMGGERRAGCQERAGAGVAQSGGCHIRGQHMTDIANILRRNGQFSSGTSLHSVKQAPACWGLRPQSPKREASADKATAAPHVAAALCQAQGWLPRISPILNVPSPADWRNLDATAVLIARPSPKLPRGPETLMRRQAHAAVPAII